MASKASKNVKVAPSPAAVDSHGICAELLGLAVPVGELRLDPKNARKHGDRNLDAITRSLTAFGQRKPIVADLEGRIIAGNGTYQTAIKLGWSHIAAIKIQIVIDCTSVRQRLSLVQKLKAQNIKCRMFDGEKEVA